MEKNTGRFTITPTVNYIYPIIQYSYIFHPMKKPLREKGNEKENKVKEKEKGLLSKNLYMIQESEKPYCTAKE